jgi:hypothetical protein
MVIVPIDAFQSVRGTFPFWEVGNVPGQGT